MTSRRAAFTLLELLVVISIIAVLAAMLMPAISMVRAQSKRMACASNLRQIGVATASYSEDWEGYIPRCAVLHEPVTNATFRWSEGLADYTETKKNASDWVDLTAGKSVLVGCTEWKIILSQNWKVGYGFTMTPDCPARPSATGRWDFNNLFGNETYFLLSKISLPANRLAVCDASDYMSGAYDAVRHNGRCNGLFFDLHVQSISGTTQIINSMNNPKAFIP